MEHYFDDEMDSYDKHHNDGLYEDWRKKALEEIRSRHEFMMELSDPFDPSEEELDRMYEYMLAEHVKEQAAKGRFLTVNDIDDVRF